jgi:hypothetical protein
MTQHILYASNAADAKHGTVVLTGTEADVSRGHCLKTEAILNYFLQQVPTYVCT